MHSSLTTKHLAINYSLTLLKNKFLKVRIAPQTHDIRLLSKQNKTKHSQYVNAKKLPVMETDSFAFIEYSQFEYTYSAAGASVCLTSSTTVAFAADFFLDERRVFVDFASAVSFNILSL